MPSWLLFLIIGAAAGWIAGNIMKGGGFGWIGNIVVGVIGAFVGGWLFGVLGITLGGGVLGTLIMAVVGAVVLLFIVGLIKKGIKAGERKAAFSRRFTRAYEVSKILFVSLLVALVRRQSGTRATTHQDQTPRKKSSAISQYHRC